MFVFFFVLYLSWGSWYVVFLTLPLAIWESTSSWAPMFVWFRWRFCRFTGTCNRESASTRSPVFVWFWWWFCWFAGTCNRESASTRSPVFVWFWWWFCWFAWTCNRESTPTRASIFTVVYWRLAFVSEAHRESAPPRKVWCGGITTCTYKKKLARN